MAPGIGLPEAVRRVLPALGPEPVWLVGGSVRDALLGRPTTDFDFAVRGDGVALGRRLANVLGADYFDLDPTRRTGRVLLTLEAGRRATFDFASLRGADILQDLAGRDFTLNAMALPLVPSGEVGALIDPLGGAADLRRRELRACSPSAIADDPIRAVRSVRLAVDLECRIEDETLRQVRQARPLLEQVSPERVRDELFRLLDMPKASAAIRLLAELDLSGALVPELEALRGLEQPPPHAFDGLEHSLATASHLADLIALLTGRAGTAEARHLAEAEALTALAAHRSRGIEYVDFAPSFGRPRRALLLWASLLHDAGKPATRVVTEGGVRFLGHETVGSRLAVEASRRLRLSTVEQAEVELTVLHHMRPEWLESEPDLTRRAVYRFFRAVESVGPSVVLLSLADLLARYVPPIPIDVWRRRLGVARRLLRAWFEEREEVVSPTPLLTGEDVMRSLGLPSGPEVGRILDLLREAQAAGDVTSRQEAEAFVRSAAGAR